MGHADSRADEGALRYRALVDALGVRGAFSSPRVREALLRAPRQEFVRTVGLDDAFVDEPIPIGHGQTISQPTVVAMMTEALELAGDERVLEIGTGSGWQAAVLSSLAREVYTVEIVAELAELARARLDALGLANVHVRHGDGWSGWPEQAPFDRVVVTAAPSELPRLPLEQLVEGGLFVVPLGPQGLAQNLLVGTKRDGKLVTKNLGPVRFVPMVHSQD